MIHQNAPHCKPVCALKSPLRDCYCHNLRKGGPLSHVIYLSGNYTVPEITSVLTPGLIPQAPVVVSCVYVAAGTVIPPAVPVNNPVVVSYV